MKWRGEVLGQSWEGRSVEGYGLALDEVGGKKRGDQTLLLIGGTHGDERATVPLAQRFLEEMRLADNLPCSLYVIPCLNPDGYARDSRYNARGVDLNRNFSTGWRADSPEPSGPAPLSEPESRLLKTWVIQHEPTAIVSLHWALAEIDGDGPQSFAMVQAMWQALPDGDQISYRWRVTGEEGDLPMTAPSGSFGRWAGHELRYSQGHRPAMITLELPYRDKPFPRPFDLPDDHLDDMRRLWLHQPGTYLNYAYAGVKAMLLAACGLLQASGR